MAALGVATPVSGQTSPGWTFVVTPYLWMSGLHGRVGINNIETDVDLGFTDILDQLKFAFMASGEAHSGPLVIGLDGIYISVGDSKVIGIRNASANVTFEQRETILQPTIGWEWNRTAWSADALLGMRYWNLSADLAVDPARLQDRTRSGTRDWLDATGGVRVRFRPMSNLHFDVAGDGGGGGSRNSWGAAGNASLDLSKRYNVQAGYRYLSVDYDRDGFLYDTHLNGFLLAFNFHF